MIYLIFAGVMLISLFLWVILEIKKSVHLLYIIPVTIFFFGGTYFYYDYILGKPKPSPVDKKFVVSGYGINVYALMLNAFHQENVTSVQPTSGRADTDGWLSTAEGQIWLDGQKALFPNADAEALYLDRVMTPSNWSAPRTLRIGIEANF